VHLRPAPALRGDEARAACARDARSPVGAASVHDNDLRFAPHAGRRVERRADGLLFVERGMMMEIKGDKW
jgi:hypothetical protein